MKQFSGLALAKIQKFPKIDLHRHLLGSARPTTVWDLWRHYGVPENVLLEQFFSGPTARPIFSGGLAQYIEPWKLLRDVIRRPEDIRRIAMEAAEDARVDGILYVEFRNSLPGLFITDGNSPQTQIPTDEYLHAIQEGFAEISNITCRLIASIPRHAVGPSNPVLVERYAEGFFAAITKFRDHLIVGVDLTGVEKGWPAVLFKDIFGEARRLELPITIHAGETEGPEEVWSAVQELGASRIGHGTSAPTDSNLVNELIVRNVVLEVCPTSGWRLGTITDRNRHPVIDHIPQIPYVICTDNPTLNATTLTRELFWARQIAGLEIESFLESQFSLACNAAFVPDLRLRLDTIREHKKHEHLVNSVKRHNTRCEEQ